MKAIKQTKKILSGLESMSQLESHGFVKRPVNFSCIQHIFVNYDLKVVVKEQWVVGKMPPRTVRVPTERFRFHGEMITIQALADTREQYAAMTKLQEVYQTSDVRSPNVAWYNDKPVYIDW